MACGAWGEAALHAGSHMSVLDALKPLTLRVVAGAAVGCGAAAGPHRAERLGAARPRRLVPPAAAGERDSGQWPERALVAGRAGACGRAPGHRP